MTLILNGTDNSATTPAVTGTDTDTGVYYPAANQVALATNGTQAMLANASQGVQFANAIGVGATTPTTSGAGITFPATQSASSNANTLDDYEEGTWALADTSGAGLSISANMATYVKIGRFVMAQFDINYPVTANTNGAQFSLPFASNNDYSSGYFPFTSFVTSISENAPGMIVNGGFVNARVMSGGGQLTNAQCSNARLMGTVCYYTTA